jgi:N4-gp56 family major capsid protein
VANQYTSILTGGLSDNTVKTMYDFAFGWALNATPIMRQFVDKRPEQVNGPSNSIVLQKYNYFSDTDVTAAKTPLNEEMDVDSRKIPATSTVTLNLNEYGDAITRTRKLTYFSFADVDMAAAKLLADECAKVIDELVQDTMVAGTQVLRPNSRATTGAVTSTDKLDSTTLRKAVSKLRRNQASPWEGNLYAIAAHPDVVHDLREETGQGGWLNPMEYGVDQSRLWAGEVGVYQGLRFHENTRLRKATDGASSAKVYRSFVMGREAIAEKMVMEPNVIVSPVTDKLQRFRSLGWLFVGGWAIYRDESFVRLESASTIANI